VSAYSLHTPAKPPDYWASRTVAVQQDRFAAVRALQDRFGGTAVLKGAGSLIATANAIALCPYGNPGMSSGGMGDLLTGIIAALRAQGLSADTAAAAGVMVHALAGDDAARVAGERGLLASDLLPFVQQRVNP
jgi:NAD(P)H-hydrate repair Nnr-like enzyme with NAD(P)H-hydrate dehydratase domain